MPHLNLLPWYHRYAYYDETMISLISLRICIYCNYKITVAENMYFSNNRPVNVFCLHMKDEERDNQGVQVSPPGFHLIYIPFAGDFRNLEIAETAKGTYVCKSYT